MAKDWEEFKRDAVALVEHGRVRGVPRHAKSVGDPGDSEVLADYPGQCRAQAAAGDLRACFGRSGHVLTPHSPAVGAAVAAYLTMQDDGPPAERFVGEAPGDRVTQYSFATAVTAPVVGLDHAAYDHRTSRLDMLPDRDQAEALVSSARTVVSL